MYIFTIDCAVIIIFICLELVLYSVDGNVRAQARQYTRTINVTTKKCDSKTVASFITPCPHGVYNLCVCVCVFF